MTLILYISHALSQKHYFIVWIFVLDNLHYCVHVYDCSLNKLSPLYMDSSAWKRIWNNFCSTWLHIASL